MNDEQIRQHFQVIRRRIAERLGEDRAGWREVDAALEDLQVIYEQMQTSLEMIEEVEEELFEQQQYYQDLFRFFPVASQLPQPLDGLRVLVVDDETDVREFVTTVLEAHGIGVRTVASAAAALEELERFRPDVLISDVRMPGEDGHSLIRQVRAREAEQGGHLPAAAIAAYLDEDREKANTTWSEACAAGFEAHLHKLVQPSEWVEMVTQLANQASRRDP